MTSFRLPCRTEPIEPLPDRLVAALYVLLRDHIHPGDIEQVTMDLAKMPEGDSTTYSNPHLEALARAYASFLMADQHYPYQDGEHLVLGPEIFATMHPGADDVVISYRGVNFVPQGGLGPMRTQGWKDAIEHLRAEAGNEYQDGWAAAIAELERVADSAESSNVSSDIKPDGVVVTDDGTRVGVYHKVESTRKCPRCGSPDPRRHPATSFEGEVQPCLHPWHGPKAPGDSPIVASWDPSTDGETITMVGGETVRVSTDADRTPPKIVGASEEPANALAAFIAQELEHWGFTIESLTTRLPDDPPHTRFRVVAEDVKLTVEVEAY